MLYCRPAQVSNDAPYRDMNLNSAKTELVAVDGLEPSTYGL